MSRVGHVQERFVASGRSNGDLAAVGPDCVLHVSQFRNDCQGADPFGTHWDNGVINDEPSVVRIASGTGRCAFAPTGQVSEPGTLPLLAIGLLLPMLWPRRKALPLQ